MERVHSVLAHLKLPAIDSFLEQKKAMCQSQVMRYVGLLQDLLKEFHYTQLLNNVKIFQITKHINKKKKTHSKTVDLDWLLQTNYRSTPNLPHFFFFFLGGGLPISVAIRRSLRRFSLALLEWPLAAKGFEESLQVSVERQRRSYVPTLSLGLGEGGWKFQWISKKFCFF